MCEDSRLATLFKFHLVYFYIAFFVQMLKTNSLPPTCKNSPNGPWLNPDSA